MDSALDDAFLAGRLIQWGLQSRTRPATEPEYQDLIDRYLDRTSFRQCVERVAHGLGLLILEADEHGLILGPAEESVFSLRANEFRPSSSSADDRLLDGLVQVAIAATVFPTSTDLTEEAGVARPPVTVEEIDGTLRRLCGELEQQARHEPDPSVAEDEAGLHEAWRVYQRRLSVQETQGNRQPRRTTRRIIERHLERLRELGCFVREGREPTTYQPTYRYQVQVKGLAATRLYGHVQSILQSSSPKPTSGAIN